MQKYNEICKLTRVSISSAKSRTHHFTFAESCPVAPLEKSPFDAKPQLLAKSAWMHCGSSAACPIQPRECQSHWLDDNNSTCLLANWLIGLTSSKSFGSLIDMLINSNWPGDGTTSSVWMIDDLPTRRGDQTKVGWCMLPIVHDHRKSYSICSGMIGYVLIYVHNHRQMRDFHVLVCNF